MGPRHPDELNVVPGIESGRLNIFGDDRDVSHPGTTDRKENTLERRSYFLAGDALCNAVTGMAAAWLATVLVDSSWPMVAGMFAGMLAGMVLGLLLMPIFVGLFGALEVMLPVMLTAMLAGMVFGMASAMQVPAVPAALLGGGLLGLLVLLLTYAVDAGLHGRRS